MGHLLCLLTREMTRPVQLVWLPSARAGRGLYQPADRL